MKESGQAFTTMLAVEHRFVVLSTRIDDNFQIQKKKDRSHFQFQYSQVTCCSWYFPGVIVCLLLDMFIVENHLKMFTFMVLLRFNNAY